MAKKTKTLTVQDTEIHFFSQKEEDFISITDIVKKFDDEFIFYNWLRNRNTVEFLGTWEQLHNPDFDLDAFDEFRMNAGLNSFSLSPKKWIQATGAVGITSKSGRYGGGTYAHRDIALEFCSWVSPVFRLYLVKEFQRLKEEETKKLSLDWDVRRLLSKVNYHIHTDAVKTHLIPPKIENTRFSGIIYASEADVLNVALFGVTAKEWKAKNPEAKGNMRDMATSEQLLVLANLENLNAEYIKMGIEKEQRLQMLNQTAIQQLQLLLELNVKKQLSKMNKKLK